MKKIILIGIMVTLLIGTMTALTWGYCGAAQDNPLSTLHLSIAQQQQILTLSENFIKNTLPKRQELQFKDLELKQLKATQPVDQKLIDSKYKDIKIMRAQLKEDTKTLITKIKSILTIKQQKQLNKIIWRHKRRLHKAKKELQNMYQKLNVNFEQQKKILAIRQDFRKDVLPLQFELQRKKLELRQLWEAKALDHDQILAKTNELTELKVQLVSKAREMHNKLKNVLTSEQLNQWDKLKTDTDVN